MDYFELSQIPIFLEQGKKILCQLRNTIIIWFVLGEIGWKYYWIPFALTLFADGNPIIGMNNKSLLSRYQQLEAKFRKLEEFVVCCICVERKRDVIFRCGHGTCQFCAKQLSICHICQKPIDMKIQMFWLCGLNTIYTIYRYAKKARSMNNHCWVKSVFFYVLQY